MSEQSEGLADPGRVLVVDDSPIACTLIGDQLEQWDYNVRTATSGAEAMAIFEGEGPFDVVVTDVMMPEIDGMGVLERVARIDPDVPVIMLSTHSEIDTVLQAVHEGAFDYVVKDAELGPLRGSVQRGVTQVRLVRENRRLMAQLHRMNRELETRVQERTRSLEEANLRLTHERAELERALERLAETQAQLVQTEKMASVGLLTAGVAHEINNPLSFLLPNFDHLRWLVHSLAADPESIADDDSFETVLEIVTECREGLYRIRDIVRELGLFSRRSDEAAGAVSAVSAVRSVLRICGSQLRRARVRIDASEALPDVHADSGNLRQVLLNLLINAAHAIADRDDEGEVVVSAEERGAKIVLHVTDNGVGMAPEQAARAFEPFYTTKRAGEGTGMGLAICRQLMERMGGTIEISSQPGQGTTVTLTMPVWREGANELASRLDAGPAAEESADPARPRMLIVDDERSLVTSLSRTLGRRFNVVGFDNGADALRYLEQNPPPDIILCDLMMPETTGMDLFAIVCERDPRLGELFLFITGSANAPGASEFVRRHRDRVVEKPLDMEQLLQLVTDRIEARATADRSVTQ